MHRLIFFMLLLLAAAGCDRVKSFVPAIPQVAQEDPKEREKREAEERKRAAEEKEAALTRLREADKLVEKWASQIQGEDGRLRHHEGLTDPDPWGNMVHIDYAQDGIYETATVRSAGPDGTLMTPDDLTRTRTVTNVLGFQKTPWGIALMTYIISIPLALVLTSVFRQRRVRLGKSRKGRPHPVLTALAAPAVAVVYGVVGLVIVIGEVFGAATDGIDLPEFDFDFFD